MLLEHSTTHHLQWDAADMCPHFCKDLHCSANASPLASHYILPHGEFTFNPHEVVSSAFHYVMLRVVKKHLAWLSPQLLKWEYWALCGSWGLSLIRRIDFASRAVCVSPISFESQLKDEWVARGVNSIFGVGLAGESRKDKHCIGMLV